MSELAKNLALWAETPDFMQAKDRLLLSNAADEIERLTAENSALKHNIDHYREMLSEIRKVVGKRDV